jgi:hypothetical protein
MIKYRLSSGYHYKGHGGKDSKSYGYKVFISRTKLYSVEKNIKDTGVMLKLKSPYPRVLYSGNH